MEPKTITEEFMYRLAGERRFHRENFRRDTYLFATNPLPRLAEYSFDHVDLWHGLWYQGEMACLFGEPNVGKTLLAIQIAKEICTRGLKTLYFDLENVKHQYKMRYNSPALDLNRVIDENLIVMPLNQQNKNVTPNRREILDAILKEFVNEKAPVIIIDDITPLIGSGDKADIHFVLNTLRSWTQHFLVSILVLAHSRKRRPAELTTIESLAGSFEYAYAFDSIFSLTRANDYNKQHNNISHFIKQHKNRMGPIIYDEMNVITALLGRDENSGSLQFIDLYTGGNERQLLRDNGLKIGEQTNQAILHYKKLHYSTREIADIINCSQSHVSRTIRKYEKQINNDSDNVIDTTLDTSPASSHEALLPTHHPRIKLEPNLTPIYDKNSYTHDPHGFPISIEDYKIYYPALYEEYFNYDNNYDNDCQNDYDESSESGESGESGESII